MNTTAMKVEVHGDVGQLVMQQRPVRPGVRWVSALSARWPLRAMRRAVAGLRRWR